MADEQQSNIRQESNAAVSGLNMDQTLNQIKRGQLTYALNAAVENYDASGINYQNEPGNELCLNFPENYHVIGTHSIVEQNKHIFFLLNPETGDSEIGYMDNNDCVYKTYINAKCLNFNINYPIHKCVHKITNCTTEIYWTDGLNSRRYLDLNNLPYKTVLEGEICDAVVLPEVDCNKLNVQPNFQIPQLDIVDVVNGGNLTSGSYQFAIQYCNAGGDGYTSYYSVTNPTPIAKPNITTPDFNYAVGKSIVVNISGIDVTGYFQYFNLAVIKTVNSVTSVELVGTYFIDNTNRQVTYNGQNQSQIRLTTNDIFEKFPYYEIAQDITAVQDVLVWDNLTSIDRINYQQIANKIKLQWQSYKLPATENYADELNATNLRGYLRDEVYAFEIVFLLKNGKQTDGFHIPGRALLPTEASLPDIPSTNPDFTENGASAPYWKIYNTATVIGDAFGDPINNAVPYKYGEFAYWESEETYPCNTDVWGELANTPIRHHKFPDALVSPIFESGSYTLSPNMSVSMEQRSIFPLGMVFDVQQVAFLINTSNLTQEQKDNIAGFKIVRGDRSTNKSIVAKGILRNVGKYERQKTQYYFPNYPYNDLTEDPFLLDKPNSSEDCGTYSLSALSAGFYSYTDCFSGETINKSIAAGESVSGVCSSSFPIVSSGVISVLKNSVSTYDITCYSTTGCLLAIYDAQGVASGLVSLGKNEVKSVTSYLEPTKEPALPLQEYKIVKTGTTGGDPNCTSKSLKAYDYSDVGLRQVFNSPETSFGSPFLGDVLKLENVMFGAGRGHHVQVTDHAFYKLITKEAQEDALRSSEKIASTTGTFNAAAMFTAYQAYLTIYINGITRKNYTYSYNSIATYDYFANIDNNLGVKQRKLDIAQYAFPGVQNVGENINLNNFNRESSVYLKTNIALPVPSQTPNLLIGGTVPSIQDRSRWTISEKGNCNTPENQFDISVVSYYASIKNTLPNQWGQIYSYTTIDTGFQTLLNTSTAQGVVFGGDTFINRFSFKTKIPFFIDNRVGAPDDSDIYYDEIGNVAYPKYWFSSRSILYDYTHVSSATEIKNIISIKAHNFDCPNSQYPAPNPSATPPVVNPGRTFYDGKMYLFAYGIPTFYCESSINVDLRQAFNNKEGDFYPHVSSGIPDQWFQETFVPIAFDNTYYYNTSYSKQNEENFFSHLPVDWSQQLCYSNFPFRAIYSDRQQSFSDNRINSWLIYRPISFFDFPQNYGKLTSLDGIQNRAVLARFENKSLLYNTLLTVDTSNPQAAYIGNDSLFRSAPPIDFAETDLGYVGSQHKMFLKIPQGQITIDAKRGQVFLVMGNSVKDLSAFGSGLNRFFTDHLAFEILRYFPNVNVDNHFNGLGLHGVYDSKFDRVLITKLDYIPLSKDVKYDSDLQEFYIEKSYGDNVIRNIVQLTDQTYFCNKSWTLSFNFNTDSWISFHTYLPNWYIGENNFYYSGLNESCDLDIIAAEQPTFTTTTTSTTTKALNCTLVGQAVRMDCSLAGIAVYIVPPTTTSTTTQTPTTTTTSTSTSTTSTTTTSTTTIALPCECHDGVVASSGYYSFYTCDGTLNTGINDFGLAICYDINKSHTDNISDEGPSDFCSCYGPTTTTTTSTTSTTSTTTTSTSTTSTTSTTTSTTTAFPYSYSGVVGKITPECCAVVGTFVTAYTTCSPIILGCILYDLLSNPIVNEKFTSAGVCYETDGSGAVITITSCTTTTTTTTTSTTTTPPTTTSTTTSEPSNYYYVAQNCDDQYTNGTFVSTNDSLVGTSFFYDGACWFITDGTVPSIAITIPNYYTSCIDCQNANS